MHAVTAAHNTLAAMVDNHLYQGNELGIDPAAVTWRRTLDVNDRALRNIVVGLGTREDGVPRQTGFDITAASEVMAILALSTSLRTCAGAWDVSWWDSPPTVPPSPPNNCGPPAP